MSKRAWMNSPADAIAPAGAQRWQANVPASGRVLPGRTHASRGMRVRLTLAFRFPRGHVNLLAD